MPLLHQVSDIQFTCKQVDAETFRYVNNKMCDSIQCVHQLGTDNLIFIYKHRTRDQQDRQCTYNAHCDAFMQLLLQWKSNKTVCL